MSRRYIRCSIASMLFACLCVAGFFAGNRAGFRQGYASGQARRQSEDPDPYPKVYEVGGLVRATGNNPEASGPSEMDYSGVMSAIERSVFPNEWEALGGECSMTVVSELEVLVVYATYGVHDRLASFLKDLSSVRTEVAEARAEAEDIREQWLQSVLKTVSDKLGTELRLISGDYDFIGPWDIRQSGSNGFNATFKYDFVDANTVRIPAPDVQTKLMDVWYFASPGLVVVSGQVYTAATTKDDSLVLISNTDPLSFMVGTRADGEPSDAHESASRGVSKMEDQPRGPGDR